MIKLWTVQDKKVLDTIQRDGVYYPDFNKSYYKELIPELDQLYAFMLLCYNVNNDTRYSGLAYTFLGVDGEYIASFPNYDYFKEYIQSKEGVIKSLWNKLSREDSVILELNYEDDFNPILMDINDFQYLMPPQSVMPPFNEESLGIIAINAAHGSFGRSALPSGLIQAHVGEIRKENIVGVYPMFEL
ncbi:hypothetical protein [Anaerococcus sp.]|uniref:hypothetical protein n=1 Tax=Anaerococcus sp. TaxID=1872515 RepID=UPI00280AC74B|nr:hypothetical protein [Anaerococcus sp.]MDU3176672.1 hypothetical protein [Anaerococcus sp.]